MDRMREATISIECYRVMLDAMRFADLDTRPVDKDAVMD